MLHVMLCRPNGAVTLLKPVNQSHVRSAGRPLPHRVPTAPAHPPGLAAATAWNRASLVATAKDGTRCVLEASSHGLEVFPLVDRLAYLHSIGAQVCWCWSWCW